MFREGEYFLNSSWKMGIYIKKNIYIRQLYDKFFLEKETCQNDIVDIFKKGTLRSNISLLKTVSLLR